MKENSFWSDAWKYGAILGVLASVSRLFEDYLIYYSSVPLERMAVTYLIELLIYAVIFIYLLVRFTKRRSQMFANEGFTFGQGFGYSFTLIILAMIIVGVLRTIFIQIMGFNDYIDGFIGRIDQFEAYMTENESLAKSMGDSDLMGDMEEMRIELRAMKQPSMFLNVWSAVNSSAFVALILASIIGFNTRRKPLN